jgi:hypothetical protein
MDSYLKKYDMRIESIKDWDPDAFEYLKQLPDIPLDYEPSPKGLAAIKLSLYVNSALYSIEQANMSFRYLWQERMLIVVSLLVRYMFEVWGGCHYSLNVIQEMQNTDDATRALALSQRLLTGARTEIILPWGGVTKDKSIHVNDLIRLLADVYEEAEGTYGFLCESCHPSSLMMTNWALANRAEFEASERAIEYCETWIEPTIRAAEISLAGMSSDAKELLRIALPYIEDDQGNS